MVAVSRDGNVQVVSVGQFFVLHRPDAFDIHLAFVGLVEENALVEALTRLASQRGQGSTQAQEALPHSIEDTVDGDLGGTKAHLEIVRLRASAPL